MRALTRASAPGGVHLIINAVGMWTFQKPPVCWQFLAIDFLWVIATSFTTSSNFSVFPYSMALWQEVLINVSSSGSLSLWRMRAMFRKGEKINLVQIPLSLMGALAFAVHCKNCPWHLCGTHGEECGLSAVLWRPELSRRRTLASSLFVCEFSVWLGWACRSLL